MSVALLTIPGGAAAARGRDYVVLSDVNSGLYVLDAPWPPSRSIMQRPR